MLHVHWTHTGLMMAGALAVLGSASPAGAAEPAAAALLPVATLLEDYDCRTPAPATRRIGQVIDGVYHEWSETYTTGPDGLRVLCIHQAAPRPATLDAAAAADLLTASRGTGAPAADNGAERERGQDATGAAILDDMIERAQPLPPLKPRAAGPESQSAAANAADLTTTETSAPLVALRPAAEAGRPDYRTFEWSVDATGRVRPGLGSAAATPRLAPPRPESERPMVAGLDERQRVANPLFPANVTGKLYSEYQDGSVFTCTATLVSQYVALTAGHCLHSRDRNGYATRVVFVPQQMQSSFGGAVARPFSFKFASAITVSARWTQISGGTTILPIDSRHDYGAVYFSTPWTYTATFAPVVYGYAGSTTYNFGYPGRVQDTDGNEGQWFDFGPENARSIGLLRPYQVREFELDISGGNSGGGYFGIDGSNLFLVGVVSYGYDDNGGGVWLGGTNESVFRSYAGWTPSVPAPPRVSSDLRAPIILTSVFDGGESYLRFFNNSPSAGTVTLRFYDFNGREVGGWQSPSIAPFAARQFVMRDIERFGGVNVGANIALSIKITSTFPGLFQHVAWNVEGESLTNLSGCSNGLSSNISTAINVHSSLLEDVYPSYIVLHSLESQTADISADVYDSVTGARVGGVTFRNVPGNASGVLSMTDFETAMGFQPNASQYHLNVVLAGNNAAYLQHQVENRNSGVTTNFTSMCKM